MTDGIDDLLLDLTLLGKVSIWRKSRHEGQRWRCSVRVQTPHGPHTIAQERAASMTAAVRATHAALKEAGTLP